jgi:hypothetical protein
VEQANDFRAEVESLESAFVDALFHVSIVTCLGFGQLERGRFSGLNYSIVGRTLT